MSPGGGGCIELTERMQYSERLHYYVVQLQAGRETSEYYMSTTATVVICYSVTFSSGVGLSALKERHYR